MAKIDIPTTRAGIKSPPILNWLNVLLPKKDDTKYYIPNDNNDENDRITYW